MKNLKLDVLAVLQINGLYLACSHNVHWLSAFFPSALKALNVRISYKKRNHV